jgi:hypothetical protein
MCTVDGEVLEAVEKAKAARWVHPATRLVGVVDPRKNVLDRAREEFVVHGSRIAL